MCQISPTQRRCRTDTAGRFIAVLLALALAACTGYQGHVYQRLPDNSIGPTIAGVALTFVKEDGSVTETALSDAAGFYQVDLSAGRYRVTTTDLDYEDYSSAPGFFVVTGSDGYQTGNFFLREPRVSTVLVVRHADRDGANDALLEPQGTDRAAKLAVVAAKAGVSAIYSTNFNRTEATAQPLATALGLDVIPYTTPQAVANMIDNDHPGDAVLVVGHSNTTTSIVDAVLGQDFYPNPPPTNENPRTDDYDNLFVIGKPVGGGQGSVLNLQYGVDSQPDTPDLSRAQMTAVVLLRHAETAGAGLSAAGQTRAEKLVHVATKSGVSAIYAPAAGAANDTVQPLAEALGQDIASYDTASLAGLVNDIHQDHAGDTVLVVGDNTTLKDFIKQFGGSPYPAIFTGEYDHLMVLFALGAGGNARLISLQYGAASP